MLNPLTMPKKIHLQKQFVNIRKYSSQITINNLITFHETEIYITYIFNVAKHV